MDKSLQSLLEEVKHFKENVEHDVAVQKRRLNLCRNKVTKMQAQLDQAKEELHGHELMLSGMIATLETCKAILEDKIPRRGL